MTIRGNLGVMGGDHKDTAEAASSTRKVVDPHDLTMTDVLSLLRDMKCIDLDFEFAPNGSMVAATGTIFFMDNVVLKLGMAALPQQPTIAKPKTAEEKAQAASEKMILNIFKELSIPSAFVLHTEGGSTVCGTVKETGMDEPINTYYFRHGASGLHDITVIGIKEQASADFTAEGSHLLTAMLPMAVGMQTMMFPPESIRITPVAIFRVINQTLPVPLV